MEKSRVCEYANLIMKRNITCDDLLPVVFSISKTLSTLTNYDVLFDEITSMDEIFVTDISFGKSYMNPELEVSANTKVFFITNEVNASIWRAGSLIDGIVVLSRAFSTVPIALHNNSSVDANISLIIYGYVSKR